MQYHFEWDPIKARENLRKHKISFERGAEIVPDPLALSVYDEIHSL
ncbi:MAG: BrnT family toxin [Thermodesulfobacteriota bacterium]